MSIAIEVLKVKLEACAQAQKKLELAAEGHKSHLEIIERNRPLLQKDIDELNEAIYTISKNK